MKFYAITLCAVAVLGAGSMAGLALAGEGGGANSEGISSKLDQQINQAVGSNSSPSSDLDARVKDLDASRAAVDQKKPASVSLSVSGWVSQEVQYYSK